MEFIFFLGVGLLGILIGLSCLFLFGLGVYFFATAVMGVFLLARKVWVWSYDERIKTWQQKLQERQEWEELRKKLQAEQERAKAEREKLKAEEEKKWWEDIEKKRRPSLWDEWDKFQKQQQNP